MSQTTRLYLIASIMGGVLYITSQMQQIFPPEPAPPVQPVPVPVPKPDPKPEPKPKPKPRPGP